MLGTCWEHVPSTVSGQNPSNLELEWSDCGETFATCRTHGMQILTKSEHDPIGLTGPAMGFSVFSLVFAVLRD